MKVIVGLIFFLLGVLMLGASFKAQVKINDLSQKSSVAVFERYNKFIKDYPPLQIMANSMNSAAGVKNNLGINISLVLIVVGFFLIMGTSPLMGAVFFGILLLAVAFWLRTIRLQLS